MATKKNELAVAGDFRLVQRYENMDPELLGEIEDELGDLDPDSGISCLQIKIPSGGGVAYSVFDEDGDEEPMKQIDAVLIFTHRANGYWPGAYGSSDDTNKAPACSSMDGKNGVWAGSGEIRSCENCPYNAYGSGTDQTGAASRGKACKNMRRLYLVMSDNPNLYLLTVPPTSVKDVNKQLAKILASGTPYTSLTVRLTLEKAKNANGITYSKVVIKSGNPLPPEIAAMATTMRRQVKEQYKSVALTLDDYTPAQGPATRGVDVQVDDAEFRELDGDDPAGDEPLPFA